MGCTSTACRGLVFMTGQTKLNLIRSLFHAWREDIRQSLFPVPLKLETKSGLVGLEAGSG